MAVDATWLEAARQSVIGYRRMIDAAVAQLSDEQFEQRPADNFASVAVLLRHLGGNLQSRWTSFLDEDGEKDTRDRDAEFVDWPGDRQSLMQWFDDGWQCLVKTLDVLTEPDLQRTVLIRGQSHTVPEAIMRSLNHIAYHVGQLVWVARLVFNDDVRWQWLTIAPGASQQFNQTTWGTAASRGVAGDDSVGEE
ncbi:MAG: DinB family protein [Pirellulaceae bacterium]